MKRRPATPEEARALANPLRMRILRLCLDADLATEVSASQAMLEAFTAELEEAGPDAATGFSRLALTLNKASQEELQRRVLAVLDEFVDRPADPDGEPLGLLFAMHRRPSPA